MANSNIHYERAAMYLRHYFKSVAEKSGLHWEHDCDMEINEIIHQIAEGVHAQIKEEIKFFAYVDTRTKVEADATTGPGDAA